MWYLDVRVRRETVLTMGAAWSMPLHRLSTCASVLEHGLDYDAMTTSHPLALARPRVSIPQITNERTNEQTNERTNERMSEPTNQPTNKLTIALSL